MVDRDFDLLGDPIPEGLGKRGRPPHLVTERNSSKVMMLLAMGWATARIAGAMGITLPTLKKYYFRELAARATALDRLKAGHSALLWDQARAGNVAALKEIMKIIDRLDAASFGALPSERDDDDDDAPRRPLGKKEEAQIAAQTAGQGSAWGDDLVRSASKLN